MFERKYTFDDLIKHTQDNGLHPRRSAWTQPIQKNHSFRWLFKMVDSSNFATPETGKTVTVTMSGDGGAFAALTGAPSVSEISDGWYYVDIPEEDMNINSGLLLATATGCAQTDFAFYTEP